MKVTVNSYHAVAAWKWNLVPPGSLAAKEQQMQQIAADVDAHIDNEDEDDDEDVCGICRVAFDGCCPDCKRPGDSCPLIWGECTHIFHSHCLLKWIGTDASKGQCPLDRRPWVTASTSA